jgi:site-specific DNA-adenine methylase
MSSNMRKTMAGGIVTPQNSFKNSHQIHFSSADKQLLAFVCKSLPDQRGISYKYWSDYAALRVS